MQTSPPASKDNRFPLLLKRLLLTPEFYLGRVRVPANLGLRFALLWTFIAALAVVAYLVN